MILPVAISGKVLVKYPPFSARLHCEFKEVISMAMHAKNLDGAFFNDNHFINIVNRVPTSGTPTPCTLTFTGGDGDEAKNAAWFASMRALYAKLVDIGIERIKVTEQDAKRIEEDFRNKAKEHQLGGAHGNRPTSSGGMCTAGTSRGMYFRGQ